MTTLTFDPLTVHTVLCDADGNLFPSEELAFEASVGVTNRLAEDLGLPERFEAEQLRLATTGKNFRSLAGEMAQGTGPWAKPRRGLDEDELEKWIAEEKRVVSGYLGQQLRPDVKVRSVLSTLSEHYKLAVVSSSASSRLRACFEATELEDFFPTQRCFSAEDSLPVPVSKPDPAVYLYALERLGIAAEQSLAVEDSVPGAQAAVAAGCPTVGNLCFVGPGEKQQRRRELEQLGVVAVIDSWPELLELLGRSA